MKMFLKTGLTMLALAAATPTIAQDADASSEPVSYAEASALTAPIADAYFEAYISRDWDALEPLLSDEASFADTTATRLFGQVRSDGLAAMMQRFRVSYAGITHMSFATTRRFVAGDVAVYEGALDWGIKLGNGTPVASVTPMVIVITIDDGKVIQHRDFVDYSPFLVAVQSAQAAK